MFKKRVFYPFFAVGLAAVMSGAFVYRANSQNQTAANIFDPAGNSTKTTVSRTGCGEG
ncbi:hypothetical protein [Lyngbya sp. PCC 8106]|uniref:hypothetical protein n=1 Tax=Lyngbya sp. (strain PCC 8106) TaxID=313612 RepID=UPI0000EA96F8|nr:hypothetical protein [Lyngbya sp. PCC 8106]EAW35626.1 hypothetical protein L8106_08156 [Lyngbya sp. PCC 8106]